MKNINFTNRRSKVKKFLIYLIPNIISLIVIYYIILFYITVEAHGDEWYVIGLLTFIFISGLFGIYVLFREIEKFFWSRKEKIAYKRLQNILEIKSIVESQEYKNEIEFQKIFNQKFRIKNKKNFIECYQEFSTETKNDSNSISIINNKIFVDGKEIETEEKVINIIVEENLDKLEVDCCNSIKVNGVTKDVKGNVNNINGNIIAKAINGNCKTTNGDILCNDWKK